MINMKLLVLIKWSCRLGIELRMVVIFLAHSPISTERMSSLVSVLEGPLLTLTLNLPLKTSVCD